MKNCKTWPGASVTVYVGRRKRAEGLDWATGVRRAYRLMWAESWRKVFDAFEWAIFGDVK